MMTTVCGLVAVCSRPQQPLDRVRDGVEPSWSDVSMGVHWLLARL